ncbi:MOSC domain containing protein [Haladaptatus paucihalophilus DX253]|uniref:MOSC domain containing protein n=1 Tax=Haladaptatus paucihalophilus DX253 TaxID=797209 RepID=E7QSM2_HALPU|nr:MOSC N-terminal beta barrel domain-containing protein [Haladaptatus paucihalophilus]EFW92431.1 MOSC domain containing protein [Haladaptatus paucihalophilus DX253]SHK05952.1 hypothetical protein SAMN05444342_0435 [Haladaptatus paucihalophilus DX253]
MKLGRIRVYPIKGLDGIEVDATDIVPGGTVASDREFALFDAAGNAVNGKQTDMFQRLSTDFDRASGELTIETPDGETRLFDLPEQRERAERWFSELFEMDLTLRRDTENGFVDRRKRGPSVISTASLRAIASWFDGMTVESARRRLRANVEIEGVPPFWEDRFIGDGSPAFEVGGVRFEGVEACNRCVIPQRDPDTGEALPEFRTRFIRKRRETLPDWVDESALDHHYAAMLIAQIPESDRHQTLRVGDAVEVVE